MNEMKCRHIREQRAAAGGGAAIAHVCHGIDACVAVVLKQCVNAGGVPCPRRQVKRRKASSQGVGSAREAVGAVG